MFQEQPITYSKYKEITLFLMCRIPQLLPAKGKKRRKRVFTIVTSISTDFPDSHVHCIRNVNVSSFIHG
jgi:hypothetical protein